VSRCSGRSAYFQGLSKGTNQSRFSQWWLKWRLERDIILGEVYVSAGGSLSAERLKREFQTLNFA